MSNFTTVNRPFNDLTTRGERTAERGRERREKKSERTVEKNNGIKKKQRARDAPSRLPFILDGKAAKTCVYKSYAKTRWKRGRALNLVNLDFIRCPEKELFSSGDDSSAEGKKSGRYTGDNEKGVENKPTAPLALLYTYLRYAMRGSLERDSAFLSVFFFENPHDFFFPAVLFLLPHSLAVFKGPVLEQRYKCCSLSFSRGYHRSVLLLGMIPFFPFARGFIIIGVK